MIPFRKEELVRIKCEYSAGFDALCGFTASVNFRTGRCRFRSHGMDRFLYSSLTKRQLGVILRQIGSSGMFGRELERTFICDDTWKCVTLFYDDGTKDKVEYFSDMDIDWRFMDTVERYLRD